MPTVAEIAAAQAGTLLKGPLSKGVKMLTKGGQEIVFKRYSKFVLPLDGFVFWVNDSILNASTMAAVQELIAAGLTAFPSSDEDVMKTVQGSVHWAVDQTQALDETLAVNEIVFSTFDRVLDFRDVGPSTLWLGSFDNMRFSFNEQGRFFEQSGLYHYIGHALYPALATQIIDDPVVFDSKSLVVSNSLSLWLALNTRPQIYSFVTQPLVPFYPSYAVPDNIVAPYVVVHIEPDRTNPIQAIPGCPPGTGSEQLMVDSVRLVMYGLRNDQAIDLHNFILQYSLFTDAIGIMETTGVRDEKRTQSELNIIAMKKSIDFKVSYYQSRVNSLSRQLIKSALVTYNPQGV